MASMTSIPLWSAALLVLVGLVAGFVNTAAGAGSLLSLRALMLLGLPADLANGSNRVPVLAQSLVAARGFDREGALARSSVISAAAVATAGALVGSIAASYTPERVMRFILILVLLAVAFFSLLGARRKDPGSETASTDLTWSRSTGIWLFVSGLYGGFLQAGVGLMLLFALSGPGKLDLLRSNALKVVIVAVFSTVSLAIFSLRGQVSLPHALALTLGSVVGAKLGVAYAVRFVRQLKIFVVVVDVTACAVLLAREFLQTG